MSWPNNTYSIFILTSLSNICSMVTLSYAFFTIHVDHLIFKWWIGDMLYTIIFYKCNTNYLQFLIEWPKILSWYSPFAFISYHFRYDDCIRFIKNEITCLVFRSWWWCETWIVNNHIARLINNSEQWKSINIG